MDTKPGKNPDNWHQNILFMQQNLSILHLWGLDKFTGFWQDVSPFDNINLRNTVL